MATGVHSGTMLITNHLWMKRAGGPKIDPAKLAELRAGVDWAHLAHATRLAENGMTIKSDKPPVTAARPSPEFKTASDNVSHVLYGFLEDLTLGALFLVSSRSAKYFRDVTCASAGTVPKGDSDWRTIVGFDKANESPEHSTNAATPMD